MDLFGFRSLGGEADNHLGWIKEEVNPSQVSGVRRSKGVF